MDLRILMDHLLKTKEEYKNSKKQEIQGIFSKTNQKKLASIMTWLLEVLKIYHEEQQLIKYYVIKDLILLKIQKYYGYQKGFDDL